MKKRPKIIIILGTRPEIIKLSPIIRQCEKRDLDYSIIHTGQHYSYSLDKVFFGQLELPEPGINLEVGSGPHGEQTGKMIEKLERILLEKVPDVVLVQGDTNTVLAGAIAASKLQIKIGHIEAGLRSFDRKMPEEINRILTDHISDYLFTPTEFSKKYLLAEGISEGKIFVTGNTIVDSVHQNLGISEKNDQLLNKYGLNNKAYLLATVHRAENVDYKNHLVNILEGFSRVYKKFNTPILFPAHPRTIKRMHEFGLNVPEGTILTDPMGYLDFLQVESRSKLILTDSGGLQEEACILKIPCVTLRDNTERPETLQVGANIIAGTSSQSILDSVTVQMDTKKEWVNPYGDGQSAERIISLLEVDFPN